MKKVYEIILAAVLIAIPVFCSAQARVYTKKARLEDFPTKVTKVIISSRSILELAFHDEVQSRWRTSPFEFGTVEDYSRLKDNNDYYFLRLAHENGILFICLSKGGKRDDVNNLKKPFEVIRMPIGADDGFDKHTFSMLGPSLDIVQNFVEDAMISDGNGYLGLMGYNKAILVGKEICLDPEEGGRLLNEGRSKTLVGVTITPKKLKQGDYYYQLLLSADTHELYYFMKKSFREDLGTSFTDKDIQKLQQRGAVIIR